MIANVMLVTRGVFVTTKLLLSLHTHQYCWPIYWARESLKWKIRYTFLYIHFTFVRPTHSCILHVCYFVWIWMWIYKCSSLRLGLSACPSPHLSDVVISECLLNFFLFCRLAGILHIFNQCFNMLDGKTTLGNWDTEINMETLRGATALAEYFALQKEILFAKVSRQQKRC